MKQYRKVLVLAACVCATLLLACINGYLAKDLSNQQLANRWSEKEAYTQIACYLGNGAILSEDQLMGVRRNIGTALEEASVTSTNENGGRNWFDAYSSEGQLSIASSRGSMDVRAFGVGGDFFQFHPLTLLSGSYFDSTAEGMGEVIIDEVVAWQLFGSSNVAGMQVEINNAIYLIRGVVRSDSGLFSEAAKEEEATIYVSYNILEEAYGEELPIRTYELLVANPVEDFGTATIKNVIGFEEDTYELVEVSTRYDLKHRFEVLKSFGVRSMNHKNIEFPYWEKRARAYEDVSALLLVLEILCLIYPVVWLGIQLRKLYKFVTKKSKKIA